MKEETAMIRRTQLDVGTRALKAAMTSAGFQRRDASRARGPKVSTGVLAQLRSARQRESRERDTAEGLPGEGRRGRGREEEGGRRRRRKHDESNRGGRVGSNGGRRVR